MKILFATLFLAILFVGCATPHFSENSPLYYDETTKMVKTKKSVCALPFGVKLDLSRLSKEEKERYLSRFLLGNNPDFCHNNKVVQIAMQRNQPLVELYYDIPCTCNNQIMRK